MFHADEIYSDEALVSRLLAAQFPEWADLPVRLADAAGTSNVIYRLGDKLSARLPRNLMKTKNTDLIMQNRIFVWIAVVTGLILSVPLVAMQFTDEVKWEFLDFIVMGALLFGVGSAFVQVARVTPRKYRGVIGIGFAVALLYVWAELAVGIFTNLGS